MMKKNVPEIRFRGFDGEWEEYKIGNIFDRIKNPVDVKKDDEYKQIGIRSHGKGIFYKEPVTGEQLGNKRVFWIEPNVFIVNIVFAWERAVARTTEKEVGMIASHRFPMYKPKKDILDLDFITELFITKRGQALLELASPGGAGRNKTLGQKEFDDLVVKLPSIQEQKRISGFLDKIDRLIEKQDEKVKNYELYKKGMMQKIFSQEIRFRGDRGEEYPEWEEKRLGDICIFYSGGTPTTSIKEYYNGEIPFIRSAEISSEKTELNISIHGLENSSAKMVKKGDLLYALYGATSGEVAISKIDGAINQAILCIKTNSCDSKYLELLLVHNKENIIGTYIQGGQGNLSANIIKNLKYKIPCIDEQKKIATFFIKIDTLIEKEGEKLENLKIWKRGLLHGMFA